MNDVRCARLELSLAANSVDVPDDPAPAARVGPTASELLERPGHLHLQIARAVGGTL
jgi:hypothetical protein